MLTNCVSLWELLSDEWKTVLLDNTKSARCFLIEIVSVYKATSPVFCVLLL